MKNKTFEVSILSKGKREALVYHVSNLETIMDTAVLKDVRDANDGSFISKMRIIPLTEVITIDVNIVGDTNE